jgi:hypothetical protein
MRALSIRQPFAELILCGIKTVEYRSRTTGIVGERFHIYAPLKKASADTKIWSRDLGMVNDNALPAWMIELAEQVGMIEADALLPTGVIVGSAVIDWCLACPLATGNSQPATVYQWHLTDVERATELRKPTRHPQPVWFNPF